MGVEELASYQHCCAHVSEAWEEFGATRTSLLRQGERFGKVPERAAEEIVRELFTRLLDWSVGDVNYQVDYADMVLTRLGIKHLVVETKRPGSFRGNQAAIDAALDQARRYAATQSVRRVAVCDGDVLYAEDFEHGGCTPRAYVVLDAATVPDHELWWLSYQGIYRARPDSERVALSARVAAMPLRSESESAGDEGLLHPKYHLPARCFAYVGDYRDPHTWKLPYLLVDGSPDTRRLPKAVQALLTNYRGAVAGTVPEPAVADTLVRLARAASTLGKMPGQVAQPATAYVELAAALTQLGRIEELELPHTPIDPTRPVPSQPIASMTRAVGSRERVTK